MLSDVTTKTVRQEAGALLRRLLAAVEAGDLAADDPPSVALVRRLEGAAVALEQTSGARGPERPGAAASR